MPGGEMLKRARAVLLLPEPFEEALAECKELEREAESRANR